MPGLYERSRGQEESSGISGGANWGPVRGWERLGQKVKGNQWDSLAQVILMTPIKVSLPPMGQTSGPLTQASAPPASTPAHTWPLCPQKLNSHQDSRTNERLEEAPAVGTPATPRGREIMTSWGLWA